MGMEADLVAATVAVLVEIEADLVATVATVAVLMGTKEDLVETVATVAVLVGTDADLVAMVAVLVVTVVVLVGIAVDSGIGAAALEEVEVRGNTSQKIL